MSALLQSEGFWGLARERSTVPFWALPADEILRAFVGAVGGTTKQRFAEFVAAARQNFVAECDWLDLDSAAITSDTPVPFDLHQVWYHLEHENNATHGKPADGSPIEIVDCGDSQSLTSAAVQPIRIGQHSPLSKGRTTVSTGRLRSSFA